MARLSTFDGLHFLQVKAIGGLGTTIDVVLVNGRLRSSDTIIVAGTEAPIVTQIPWSSHAGAQQRTPCSRM